MPERPQPKHRLRALARPKILLPLVLTSALLAVLLSMSDLGHVLARVQRVSAVEIALTCAMALSYLTLKGMELRYLLRRLGLTVDLPKFFLAFAVGEMCVPLPAGVYMQNYILSRLGSARLAHSGAATTVMLALEALVALLFVLVLGIPAWAWLRPLIIAVLVAVIAGRFVLVRFKLGSRLQRRLARSRLRPLYEGLCELGRGLQALASPRGLIAPLALTLGYLSALSFGFCVVANGVGLQHFSFAQAAVVYNFSLAVLFLLGGVLSQLGVVESAGVAAAHALGYPLDVAVAALLSFRLIWLAFVWLASGLCVLMLRHKLGGSSHDREKPCD